MQTNDVKLLLLYSNIWNHLSVYKKMSSGSFKNIIKIVFTNHIVGYLPKIPLTCRVNCVGGITEDRPVS